MKNLSYNETTSAISKLLFGEHPWTKTVFAGNTENLLSNKSLSGGVTLTRMKEWNRIRIRV